MAGWISNSDSDDEPLNLQLFTRKSFGFRGILEGKENILKNIVKQIGATCDDFPKYVFTSLKYYNSLTDHGTPLYDVAFIRDCIDANRYLNIEQYRLGPKCTQKRDFREFEPCCGNFHKDQDTCIICDPEFKSEVPNIKQKKIAKLKSNESTNSENESQLKLVKKKNAWEPWECRLLLDYIICNKLFFWVKSPSLYKKIAADGILKHRSAESMRVHFRKNILRSIESYDLPLPILRTLKRIRKAEFPGRKASKKITTKKKFTLKTQIKKKEKIK